MIYIKIQVIISAIMLSFLLMYCSLGLFESNTEKKYTVTFETNDGNEISPQKVSAGEKAIKPTLLSGISHGCYSSVEDWFLDAAFENKFDFNTPIESDITIYIKWDTSTFNTDETPKKLNQIYQICNWKQLQWIAKDTARLDDEYKLVEDIVFPNKGEDGFPAWGFIPIGYDVFNSTNSIDVYDGTSFSGTFDGNNKTISNFSVDAKYANWTVNGALLPDTSIDNDFIGLFGQIDRNDLEPVVKDLTLILATGTQTSPSIAADYYIGGLVGKILNGKIENVIVQDGYIRGSAVIGGIVGWIETGEIRGYNTSTIHTYDNTTISLNVGGLVGKSNKSITIGYTAGNITATNTTYVGGLVGTSSGLVVGYTAGDISGGYKVGGLVGQTSNNSVIGYAVGTVTAKSTTGPLIAETINSELTGYWDITQTGLSTSIGSAVHGISNTKNIVFNNNYIDDKGTPSTEDDTIIFNVNAFTNYFDVMNGANATWPKFKTTAFSLPQPIISDIDENDSIEVTFPIE